MNRFSLLLVLVFFFSSSLTAKETEEQRLTRKVRKKMESWVNPLPGGRFTGKVALDSVWVRPPGKKVLFYFNRQLSYLPVREASSKQLVLSLGEQLGRKYRDWEIMVYTDGRRLEELIPNSLRKDLKADLLRFPVPESRNRVPLVRKAGGTFPDKGLFGNAIALWSSHGWYYESKLDRWEWQRARLFGTVEELYTKSIVIPFLVPMLENSGATVLLPVERDCQTREVVADNDFSSRGSVCLLPQVAETPVREAGFLLKDTLYTGENPFLMGTSLKYKALPVGAGEVTFLPSLEAGDYAVYVAYRSYPNSCPEVKFTVHAGGGSREFLINQKMGGGTWIYLGTFRFPGSESPTAKNTAVTVSLQGREGEVISVDAVRFGGGMGNVARRPSATLVPNVQSVRDTTTALAGSGAGVQGLYSWKTSGKSRYREAARYYLQYAGFPDTLVYSLNEGRNDYNDDYQSRGEWVNYLMGSPNGPQKQPDAPGLKIPVDLILAFHTDAGITRGDTIVGTLGIYSTWAGQGLFPDGSSRMASRDLTDLVQSQIVDDIRELYNPGWTRRGLWDRQYSEAWRPNAPAMLLELLSHQNLADMTFGLDPRFRFSVARAIYKGMLRFQAARENRNPVIHPLPVNHMALHRVSDTLVRLSWKPVADPLEPTAWPTTYKVYRQMNNQGWDEGTSVKDTFCILPLESAGDITDFRVTALNSGGESFPGETVSAGFVPNSKGTVLIVNAFDRICAPATFDAGEKAGIEWWRDQGVSWNASGAYTGNQYDFDRTSVWTDDDNPGWGSSHADMENLTIPGNSFNFAHSHAGAFLHAGYNVVTVSDETFVAEGYPASGFFLTDILLGEERATPSLKDHKLLDYTIYTSAFTKKLIEIAGAGGNILLSGAYPGSDFVVSGDTLAARFAREYLHFTFRTRNGCLNGRFHSTDRAKPWFDLTGYFNTGTHPDVYTVEAPDGIEPVGENAFTCFRYSENNVSGGVAYRGDYRTLVLGFPLETVVPKESLNNLVADILHFFEAE